jgi:hypothetical protein
VTETAYTRAKVYRFDPATSTCVTLLLEAPSDACRAGFLVNGAWCLGGANLALDVTDCGQGTATAATSITGSFSVSAEQSFEADVTLHFEESPPVPAELMVNLSGCRLAGCTSMDCRN